MSRLLRCGQRLKGLTRFWKNHSAWPAFSMTQLVSSVFCTTGAGAESACTLPTDAVNETLEAALGNGGGGTTALLRHAVSALLSSGSANIDYPWTDVQIVSAVDAAIASGNATNVNNLETQLSIGTNWRARPLPPPTIPTPAASISTASVSEGNSGTTNATFTVTLSFAPFTPVTIAWATADGTATVANHDYTASSGTLRPSQRVGRSRRR